MNFAIKFLIASFCSSLIHFQLYSCELKQNLVSLSGPISFYLSELGLGKSPKLLAISSFHYFMKGYNGKYINGGVFLATKELKDIEQEYTVVSDFSYELEKNLKKLQTENSKIKNVELIDSRQKESFVFFEELTKKVLMLTEGCGEKMSSLQQKVNVIKNKLHNFKFTNKTHVFFLGGYSEMKKAMVLNRDGFNLSLLSNKSYHSYPSELAYLTASQKVLNELGANTVFYYLQDAKGADFKVEKKAKNEFEITSEGALVPGLSQIYFLDKFLANY